MLGDKLLFVSRRSGWHLRNVEYGNTLVLYGPTLLRVTPGAILADREKWLEAGGLFEA
jgi:hypothetical protein